MISIIIPCYATINNSHGDYVKRAVHSALRQSYQNIEIIVVDDGSPVPIINVWGNPVRVLRHQNNQGLSAALNTGVRKSLGDRFIILASDDELRQDCIEKLQIHNADVVCSDFQGDKGGVIKCRPADLRTLITAGNCHSYAALIKKTAYDRTPGFRTSMNPSWEDWCFFIDLAKTGATWAYVPEPLHLYHRNPNGRDVESQTKVKLLQGKLHGHHPELFGAGKGLVTFVIPCYKQEQWVGDAVNSVYAQTYPHVNAVVVDDGSPGDVVNAVSITGHAAHVVRQRNKHLSSARNTGINYALTNFKSEYLVMLDADDTVHPDFIELLMGELEDHQYVYTDIQFIGDAWHQYTLKEYDCRTLVRQHIHQCTFLAPSQMYIDIINQRGYVYDEMMKKGYEDWEFALAALRYGWCGKRMPKFLFNYRYHNGGSMRIEAGAINDELTAYVKNKHTWISNLEAVNMACSSCGGRNVGMRQVVNKNGGSAIMVNVPGIGMVDGREPLRVTFKGSRDITNTFTKIGASGNVYKYSSDPAGTYPNVFTIFAIDAHLFNGPYSIDRLNVPVITQHVVIPQPISVAPVEIVPEEDPLIAKYEAREAVAVTAIEPDDFTKLKNIGNVGSKQLVDAGFVYFSDIADAAADEISMVLKCSKKSALSIIEEAGSLART